MESHNCKGTELPPPAPIVLHSQVPQIINNSEKWLHWPCLYIPLVKGKSWPLGTNVYVCVRARERVCYKGKTHLPNLTSMSASYRGNFIFIF